MQIEDQINLALELLDEAAEHMGDSGAPNVTWFKRYYSLGAEHMILTHDGWEPGESKDQIIGEGGTILDEVNAPKDEQTVSGSFRSGDREIAND